MKKILIIIVILIGIIFAALATIPLFFKEALLEKTKATINQNVNAQVEFSDFRLSLFRPFPKLTVELMEISVTGTDEFKGDTLFEAGAVRARMPFIQLFNPENMQIEEISLHQPRLKMVVAETGKGNWDLMKETTVAEPVDSGKTNGLNLQLEKFKIEEAFFEYADRETGMAVKFDDINLVLSGEMYGTSADLEVTGGAGDFSVRYGDISYISKWSMETRTLLNVDYEKLDIKISENELQLNQLPLEVNGGIQIPGDSLLFDLDLKSKTSGFDNLLSMVPPEYASYLEEFETSGNATLSGKMEGVYFEENYPAFQLDMIVENGNLHYEGLPEGIKNISGNISITKPQGELDLAEVKIENAHAEVKNNPVDFQLVINQIISDPYFDGALKGKLDFSDLKSTFPMDSIFLAGFVDADVMVNGHYSAIEKEEYSKIQSDGTVLLSGFEYDSPELTRKVLIPEGRLEFSPRDVTLSQFRVNVGQSDFNLSGKVSNYLGYYFSDANLSGDLEMNSSLVNLNELLRLQKGDEETGEESLQEEEPAKTESLAFDIPENIDFVFRSSIRRVVFDQLPVSDVKGLITAQNGKLVLDGLSMQMLDGRLELNGSYWNTPENQPFFDFGLDASRFDIPMAYQTLTGFRKLLPVAGQSQGKMNTDLNVSGRLSQNMKIIGPTVNGSGSFGTENLRIVNSPVFNQLRGILKAEKLKNVAVNDFRARVEIEEGGIQIKPFTTQIAGQETSVTGSINTQNIVDFRLDFNVERDAFGPDIQQILAVLPGEERIQEIPASVIVQGPAGEAQVKVDLEAARKKITEEVKKSTKEDLQRSLNKIGEGLRKLFK